MQFSFLFFVKMEFNKNKNRISGLKRRKVMKAGAEIGQNNCDRKPKRWRREDNYIRKFKRMPCIFREKGIINGH